MKKIRCAIYTRKSAEEGLEQEFNSLDAQREACAAYVASQKAEGWVLLPTVYEDAGLSGGTLERPGLQRLLADIDAGLVDQIVVYKVDRLTRSLSDFAKLVERLEAAGAVFVSVTQSFNTATSMGRLTLHMLLSFAQFEREVTAERIRDKVAASKRKGLWMGGRVPLGYEKDERTLRINEAEAETVQTLYALYRQHGTLRQVKAEADRLRLRTKQRFAADGTRTGWLPFRRGHLHCLLTNPLYAGRIRHQRRVYEGQHPSIIAPELWDAVQTQLQAGAAKPRRRTTKGRAVGPDSHHPIISLSGIPSAVIVLRILHPILASTLCAANPVLCQNSAVPSIYSSARPELDWSSVYRHHTYMISSFVLALIFGSVVRRALLDELEKDVARLEDPGVVGKQTEHDSDQK